MTAEDPGRRPPPRTPAFYIEHAPRLPAKEKGDRVDLDVLLPGRGDLEIEVGPGRGNFVYERVLAAPEVRFLAFEVRLKWAYIVDEKLGKLGLHPRARVFAEDAKEALARLSPEGSVKRVFIHFPDPWWKKRHSKRLVVGSTLLDSIVWLLQDGGELFVQTDVEHRADGYEDVVEGYPDLVPAGDVEGQPLLAVNPYGARSNREVRADQDELPVTRLRWRRRDRDLAAE